MRLPVVVTLSTQTFRNFCVALRSALPSTFGAMAVPSLAEYLGAKWLMTAGGAAV